MQIRIPHRLVKIWDRVGDWGDVEPFKWRLFGYAVRRIDLVIALSMVWVVAGYALSEGWMGLLKGVAMAAFITVLSWLL
jgi:hypothetical protein